MLARPEVLARLQPGQMTDSREHGVWPSQASQGRIDIWYIFVCTEIIFNILLKDASQKYSMIQGTPGRNLVCLLD